MTKNFSVSIKPRNEAKITGIKAQVSHYGENGNAIAFVVVKDTGMRLVYKNRELMKDNCLNESEWMGNEPAYLKDMMALAHRLNLH